MIVGCGRVGSRLARSLETGGHDVTLIDRDPGAFTRFVGRGVLSPELVDKAVVGDGCDSELLRRAGIEGTDAFVAVTEGDNRNIMAAQIARHVYRVSKVVCRIYDPIREEVYRGMGLQTFCPTIDGERTVSSMILGEQG
jgi:trk system potassium uptake protein TrkA